VHQQILAEPVSVIAFVGQQRFALRKGSAIRSSAAV